MHQNQTTSDPTCGFYLGTFQGRKEIINRNEKSGPRVLSGTNSIWLSIIKYQIMISP